MPAAALTSGGDRPAPRRTLALSLSLLIHSTFLLLIFAAVRRDVAPPPLEIAIIEGSEGAAGQSGEEPAEGRPLAAARTEAPRAPIAHEAPAASRMKTMAKPVEPSVAKPVVEDERRAASPISTPVMPTFDGALSSATASREPAAGDRPQDGGGGAAGGLGDGAHASGFSISGAGRSYASIWQGTQRYLAGLRWAYNNELRANAALRGVVVVRYEILADGAVGDVALVSSQLQAPRLEQQVLSQIRDWRYPPEPTGTVIVTWPFSFLPPR